MLGKGPIWGLFTLIYDWQQNISLSRHCIFCTCSLPLSLEGHPILCTHLIKEKKFTMLTISAVHLVSIQIADAQGEVNQKINKYYFHLPLNSISKPLNSSSTP
jgi:hypothetical protein